MLETSRLWREVVTRIHAEEFPHIELEHVLVDNAAMQLISAPRHFDVIVTENMFGDILTDEAAMLTGSIGHAAERLARREPTRGCSSPSTARRRTSPGQGIANPLGDDPLGRADAAARTRPGGRRGAVESAVDRALDGGLRTRTWAATATTAETTADAVLEELHVNQADLIWMNGELVAYEDAKVHVLTHALHYGTSVFEGVRAYETAARHRRLPPPGPHRPAVPARPRSTTWTSRSPRTRSAPRRSSRSPATGLKSCYIRPLVFRGAGPMGLYPLDCPVDVIIAVWEWGAYLGEEGKQNGVRAQGLLLAADRAPTR